MKALVILIFLGFTAFTNPVLGDQYLTEAEKALLLKNSMALGLAKEKINAQYASENDGQTNVFNQKNGSVKSYQTSSRYLRVANYHQTSLSLSASKSTRPPTQSLQSALRNTNWGTPIQSKRPAQQGQQLATKSSKSKWSNFFNNVSQVANAINTGLNQANSQVNPYIQQPINQSFGDYGNGDQTYGGSGNQIINTYGVGNQTYGVGGSQEFRTYDAGNLTFGSMGGQEIREVNLDNMSIMKIGNQKRICTQVGSFKKCE